MNFWKGLRILVQSPGWPGAEEQAGLGDLPRPLPTRITLWSRESAALARNNFLYKTGMIENQLGTSETGKKLL